LERGTQDLKKKRGKFAASMGSSSERIFFPSKERENSVYWEKQVAHKKRKNKKKKKGGERTSLKGGEKE